MRYVRRGRVRLTPELRDVRDRALKAMRMAGCRASTVRRLSVRFWDEIEDRLCPDSYIYGLTSDGTEGKINVDVAVKLDPEGTLLHELAHVYLWPAQGERFAGQMLDDHCPIFDVTLRQIRKWYERERYSA